MQEVQIDITKTILLSDWYTSPLWASWATRLDDSHMFYVLPEEYNILVRVTGVIPSHFVWHIGVTGIVVLGNADPTTVRHSMFYNTNIPCNTTLAKWASILENHRNDEKQRTKWDSAFYAQWQWTLRHRQLTRHIGRLLEVDMDDMDIPKSTLVQYALAYLYHWPDSHDNMILKESATRVVRELYLNKSDHKAEFTGIIDSKKLIADCLALHVASDKKDEERGWNIDSYLPECCKEDFKHVKKEYGHIDMYYSAHTMITRPVKVWCYSLLQL